MYVKDALNEVMDDCGISRYAIAKKMGKSQNFVYNIMGKPTYPSYGVMSEIADICGYDLAFVKRDGSRTITLDPPEK